MQLRRLSCWALCFGLFLAPVQILKCSGHWPTRPSHEPDTSQEPDGRSILSTGRLNSLHGLQHTLLEAHSHLKFATHEFISRLTTLYSENLILTMSHGEETGVPKVKALQKHFPDLQQHLPPLKAKPKKAFKRDVNNEESNCCKWVRQLVEMLKVLVPTKMLLPIKIGLFIKLCQWIKAVMLRSGLSSLHSLFNKEASVPGDMPSKKTRRSLRKLRAKMTRKMKHRTPQGNLPGPSWASILLVDACLASIIWKWAFFQVKEASSTVYGWQLMILVLSCLCTRTCNSSTQATPSSSGEKSKPYVQLFVVLPEKTLTLNASIFNSVGSIKSQVFDLLGIPGEYYYLVSSGKQLHDVMLIQHFIQNSDTLHLSFRLRAGTSEAAPSVPLPGGQSNPRPPANCLMLTAYHIFNEMYKQDAPQYDQDLNFSTTTLSAIVDVLQNLPALGVPWEILSKEENLTSTAQVVCFLLGTGNGLYGAICSQSQARAPLHLLSKLNEACSETQKAREALRKLFQDFDLSSALLSPRGFRNFGCTCFVNSVLQQLFSIPDICRLIMNSRPGDDSYCKELQNLLIEANFPGHQGPMEPKGLSAKLDSDKNKNLLTNKQQDAVELFHTLVGKINEEIATDVPVRAQHKSKSICDKCQNEVPRESTLFPINLYMERGSLKESLQDYKKGEETREMTCESCGNNRHNFVNLGFTFLPQILVFHLNRFSRASVKDCSKYSFPNSLDLSDSMWDGLPGDNCKEYQLSGVLVHSGRSISCGHYFSIVWRRSGDKGQWFKCNDENVVPLNEYELDRELACYSRDQSDPPEPSAHKSPNPATAYMLFYEKVHQEEQQQQQQQLQSDVDRQDHAQPALSDESAQKNKKTSAKRRKLTHEGADNAAEEQQKAAENYENTDIFDVLFESSRRHHNEIQSIFGREHYFAIAMRCKRLYPISEFKRKLDYYDGAIYEFSHRLLGTLNEKIQKANHCLMAELLVFFLTHELGKNQWNKWMGMYKEDMYQTKLELNRRSSESMQQDTAALFYKKIWGLLKKVSEKEGKSEYTQNLIKYLKYTDDTDHHAVYLVQQMRHEGRHQAGPGIKDEFKNFFQRVAHAGGNSLNDYYYYISLGNRASMPLKWEEEYINMVKRNEDGTQCRAKLWTDPDRHGALDKEKFPIKFNKDAGQSACTMELASGDYHLRRPGRGDPHEAWFRISNRLDNLVKEEGPGKMHNARKCPSLDTTSKKRAALKRILNLGERGMRFMSFVTTLFTFECVADAVFLEETMIKAFRDDPDFRSLTLNDSCGGGSLIDTTTVSHGASHRVQIAVLSRHAYNEVISQLVAEGGQAHLEGGVHQHPPSSNENLQEPHLQGGTPPNASAPGGQAHLEGGVYQHPPSSNENLQEPHLQGGTPPNASAPGLEEHESSTSQWVEQDDENIAWLLEQGFDHERCQRIYNSAGRNLNAAADQLFGGQN